MKVERREFPSEVKILDATKGMVEYVASDSSIDSQDEIVDVKGWQFDFFKKNSPFVDSHDYSTIDKLLGRVVNFEVIRGKLVETVQWAIDCKDNRLAQLGWQMTQGGFLKAVSVGFYPVRRVSRYGDQAAYLQELNKRGLTPENGPSSICLEQQQIELSAVIVGANPNAVARAAKAGALSDSDLDFLDSEYAKRRPSSPAHGRAVIEQGQFHEKIDKLMKTL